MQAATGATTPASPPASFLGRHIEIAIVTPDAYKTMAGLHRLGIGPWRVYTFSPDNTTNQTFRGQPSPFELRVCFAEGEGGVIWELMQPLSGRTIFQVLHVNLTTGMTLCISQKVPATSCMQMNLQEFLDAHGASGGIQHLAFDCNNIPFAERVAGFEQRGFKMVQGGSWMGRNHFAFFETEEATTTCFETYEFPADWEYPEPEAWYPSRS